MFQSAGTKCKKASLAVEVAKTQFIMVAQKFFASSSLQLLET